MRKQIAYLAFFITLVAQFVLSPAMAMPKFLHASSHALHQQAMAVNAMKGVTAAPNHLSATTPFNDSSLAAELQGDDAMNCASNTVNLTLPKIDCEALCDILGAENCASHGASAPGIIEQHLLAFNEPSSLASIQTRFWSLQTVELASTNPPPIPL